MIRAMMPSNDKEPELTEIHKMLKRTTLLAAISALMVSASAAADTRLAIGSTSTVSPFYSYFVSVSNIINDNMPGYRATTVETGASVENLVRMGRGQLDMGMITTDLMDDAIKGEGKFKGHAVDAKLLWVYFNIPQLTLVREDSGVQSFSDLDGKDFAPGMRGSATEAATETVLDLLKIKPKYFRASAQDGMDAVKDKRVVGWTSSSMGHRVSASQIDVGSFVALRPLSLTAEQAEQVEANIPQLNVEQVPAGAADGYPAFTTWSMGLGVAATADMDEETAYNIVKSVMEHRDPQTNAMPQTADFDFIELTLQFANTPLHPGAVKYFEEQGYDVPAELK